MEIILAVAGYDFGDEGKAKVVDFLSRKYGISIISRYNGGSQAAHHVVTPEGITHCFSQFGSGSFLPGAKTFLTRHTIVDPLMIMGENEVLSKKGVEAPIQRLIIDRRCLVATPFHKIINRMQEVARGHKHHGSCGRGIGQTVIIAKLLGERALMINDFFSSDILYKKLKLLRVMQIDMAEQICRDNKGNRKLIALSVRIKNPDYINWLMDEYLHFAQTSGAIFINDDFSNTLIRKGNIVFEGAQGVLLDPEHGFWPHITKTRTTFKNALELIKDSGYQGDVVKIGVLRAYSTRHGAGPFVTEDERLTKAIPEMHNSKNAWQGKFRIGWFDLVATRYAIEVAGKPDYFVVTNLDRLNGINKVKVCSSYEYTGKDRSLLGAYFEWKSMPGGKIIITKIKKTVREKDETLTRLIFDCAPFEFKEFNGWKNTSEISETGVLPEEIKEYINFLSSPKGLDAPIKILSFGPTCKETIEI